MPLKLVSDQDFKMLGIAPGTAVPKKFIADLIDENLKRTKKKRKGQSPGTPAGDMDPRSDAKSCWFPYNELEKLFNENGFSAEEKSKFGLRIYYGMHDKGHEFHRSVNGVPLPKESYDGQHTVVLVVTKKNEEGKNADQLIDNVSSLSYGGQGMDIGSLCPPDCNDGQSL